MGPEEFGASVSGAVYHSNTAQPLQSLIKSVCYPHLDKGKDSNPTDASANANASADSQPTR